MRRSEEAEYLLREIIGGTLFCHCHFDVRPLLRWLSIGAVRFCFGLQTQLLLVDEHVALTHRSDVQHPFGLLLEQFSRSPAGGRARAHRTAAGEAAEARRHSTEIGQGQQTVALIRSVDVVLRQRRVGRKRWGDDRVEIELQQGLVVLDGNGDATDATGLKAVLSRGTRLVK